MSINLTITSISLYFLGRVLTSMYSMGLLSTYIASSGLGLWWGTFVGLRLFLIFLARDILCVLSVVVVDECGGSYYRIMVTGSLC